MKKLGNVYLIFGADDYLVEIELPEVLDSLRERAGGDVAVETVDCEESDLDRVIGEILAPSLFSLNKATVLKHFSLTAQSRLPKEIEACIEAGLAPGQFLVIVADAVDRRLKLAKLVEKEGTVIELAKVGGEVLGAWIAERLRRAGKRAGEGVAEILADLKGDDLRAIDSEIEKVATYVGDRETVERADVEAVVGRSRTERVFALTRSVVARRTKEALDTVGDLIDAGETGIGLVYLLGRELRWQVQVRLFLAGGGHGWRDGMTDHEFYSVVLPRFKAWTRSSGISERDSFLYQKPYAAYCRFNEVRHLNFAGLLAALERLVAANADMVSTSLDDRLILERLVCSLG